MNISTLAREGRMHAETILSRYTRASRSPLYGDRGTEFSHTTRQNQPGATLACFDAEVSQSSCSCPSADIPLRASALCFCAWNKRTTTAATATANLAALKKLAAMDRHHNRSSPCIACSTSSEANQEPGLSRESTQGLQRSTWMESHSWLLHLVDDLPARDASTCCVMHDHGMAKNLLVGEPRLHLDVDSGGHASRRGVHDGLPRVRVEAGRKKVASDCGCVRAIGTLVHMDTAGVRYTTGVGRTARGVGARE
mmetsp:Transcript_12842/g.35030  ORF Transcript_12842/g.35030 Transcript_12842/m.35030 type:complete len:253 (-) Transcript_12842:499-1257(-)